MSTTANKVTNPMKVITDPDTRWSYANVWEPKSINGGTPSTASASSSPSPTPRRLPRSRRLSRPLTRKTRPS